MSNFDTTETVRLLARSGHPANPLAQLRRSRVRVERMLRLILTMETLIMATLDEVLADVTEETSIVDSVDAFIVGLKQQLAEALATENLKPETQAKIDTLFASVRSNKTKLATALTANTPAAP
jgi:hypothetical protein